MPAPVLSGSLRLLVLFDVAEEIRLADVRAALGSANGSPALRTAPEYVRFENPPVVEPLTARFGAENLAGQAQYYDYGVISLEFVLPFEKDWSGLVALAADWMNSKQVERYAAECLERCLERHGKALIKPSPAPLSEDYCTVHVLSQPDLPAAALIEKYRAEIAQIIRGERQLLSADEQADILQSRLSYYPNDVVVAGWSAAFVYDTAEGAATTFPLIEYANTQLLEFRHYDAVLTGTLATAYDRVEAASGFLERLRIGRQADRLNGVLIEVRELTERADNAIKFLSDMFSARLHRLVSARVGVDDYRKLVDDKLSTATELYHFMVEQRNHRRALILELTVVIILLIELAFFFRDQAK